MSSDLSVLGISGSLRRASHKYSPAQPTITIGQAAGGGRGETISPVIGFYTKGGGG